MTAWNRILRQFIVLQLHIPHIQALVSPGRRIKDYCNQRVRECLCVYYSIVATEINKILATSS